MLMSAPGHQPEAVECNCHNVPACGSINIEATTSQIAVTGLSPQFTLQNVTYLNGSLAESARVFNSNMSVIALLSGTQYILYYGDITQSCCANITTKPMPVKPLPITNVTSTYVFVIWDKPAEYQSYYTYRVQTTTTSSAILINETTVTSESALITNLTPGETYTFTVFTRAGDNVTESQPVSYVVCTVPGTPQNITVGNNNSLDFIAVDWVKPEGKVDFYIVAVSGDFSETITTNSTHVSFQDLLPGGGYSITIQTVSGSCGMTLGPIKQATYPTPPGLLTITNIGTNSISLSWGEPMNMTSVTKSFTITYSNGPGTGTVSSNTLNVTLQSLTSGTNYTITVVTVGAQMYQSSGVSRAVYTKPMVVTQLRVNIVTSDSLSLIWDKPAEYQSYYTYRVQTTNTSSIILINETIVTSESALITNLTPGETYTFTVFTRAGDNVTESQPASYTTCMVGALNITVNNMSSTTFLGVSWINSAGNVDYYNAILTGEINRTITAISTPVSFPDLLPGREYSITIQTVSGNCSQTAAPVTEATYPTPPGSLNFTNIGTNSISLSWGEPINMTSVTKSFTITYSNGSVTGTVSSNTLNVTLQSLTSGTNYTITVVTVGVWLYQSSGVSRAVYTKPMFVNQLRADNVTSDSIFLIWDKPVEYQSYYTYRVQTTTTSSTIPINELTVTSESALITNLTPGETYTFTVFTRAGDNVTESQPVSYITCTAPGAAQTITVTNNQSTNSLGVTWTKPNGMADNYTVALTGEINRTITTSSTQYNIPDLLPGREYSITIQTVSGNCSQTAAPVTEATYPTSPDSVNFTNIGTNSISLSWGEPINMTSVTKSFTITYSNGPGTGTVSSNTLNVTLQSLTSGTNYTITVVTVGAQMYQSSGVSRAVYTKPMFVNQLRADNVTSDSISLIWDKPVEYQSYYTYRVQTTTTSSTIPINETTVTSESALITNLTPGETYTFTVFTRAGDNITESQPVSYITCTVPGAAQTITVTNNKSTNSLGVTWTKPNGMADNYTVALTGEINRTITTSSTQYNIPDLLPGREYSITIQTVSGNCSQTAAPVTEATYPTSPDSVNFTSIGTSNISLSWGEPINMTNVTKSFTITYSNGSVTGTVSSRTLNVTLQSLTSGTNYTITVVTVGVRLYQSSGVSRTVYTKPLPVTQVRTNNVTLNSVSLIWDKPVEYQSYYTYRVQTTTTSSIIPINETTVTSESALITNLTPGETYTFTVFTRAGDNVTESQPVSYVVCTVPGTPQNITVGNNNSLDFIAVDWVKPEGKVDFYIVAVSGDFSETITTNSTHSLTSGTNYTITVVTVGAQMYQSSGVSRAVYTKPMVVTQLRVNIVTSDSLSLIWDKPAEYQMGALNITVNNMSSTTFLGVSWINSAGNVDYYNAILTGEINRTITAISTPVSFPDLLPGREYSITIQTVSGNCSQTAAPVTEATYPTPPGSLNFTNIGTNSISLSWGEPINMTSVTKSFTITYSNGTVTGTVSSNTLNVTLQSLTSGTNYTITVVTVGAQMYQSSGVSRAVYTKPMFVNQLRADNVTSDSIFLIWDKPAEYQSYYTYRVQTTTTSSTILINVTTVTSESALITNLTPGKTYTFTVFTRAGDNVTESQPVSYITCTAPGAAQTITVTNNKSTNSLGVTWTKPNGMADNYTVALTGEINRTITTSSTQYNIPDLLPGREYSITIQTVSGNCSQTAAPVTEATYPTSPDSVNFTNIGTNSISLSWGEPINMANIIKSFIITYSNGSVTGTVSSRTLNVTLQSLTSGTNYTITVVTVGVRLYQSSGVSRAVYTKPMFVNQLRADNVTSDSISLIWDKPAEYQSYYTYRVQTTTTSSTIPINETTVTSESALITNLTPGETYTFTVFTRAGDNITESQPVSYITCTVPGAAQTITVTNNQSTNSLGVTWTKPNGMADNYTVALTGEINRTITTSSTQYNIPDLLPGREYSITIQTVSGNCSQTAAPVTEATYPTPPGSVNFPSIGTSNISLSWEDPMNMTSVTKSFTITYSNGSVTGTVLSRTLNDTLQILTSGTNYTITVVTVGVRLYQSSGVSRAVYTIPDISQNITVTNKNSINFLGVSWIHSVGRVDYYTVTLNGEIGRTIQTISTPVSFPDLLPGREYSIIIQTVSGNCSQTAAPVTEATYPVPLPSFQCSSLLGQPVLSLTWICPIGAYAGSSFTLNTTSSALIDITLNCTSRKESITLTDLIIYSEYLVTMTRLSCGTESVVKIASCWTSVASPPPINRTLIQTDQPATYNGIVFSFDEFANTNGPVQAYAVIISAVNVAGKLPASEGILDKTYIDFKNKKSDTYVTYIIANQQRLLRSNKANTRTVQVGDGSKMHGYVNGPLEPLTSYCQKSGTNSSLSDRVRELGKKKPKIRFNRKRKRSIFTDFEKLKTVGTHKLNSVATNTSNSAATSTQNSAATSTQNSAATSTQNSAATSTQNSAATSTQNSAATSTQNSTATSTQNSTATRTQNSTATSTQNSAATSTQNSAATRTQNSTATSTQNSAATSTQNSAATSTQNSAATSNQNSAATSTQNSAATSTFKSAASIALKSATTSKLNAIGINTTKLDKVISRACRTMEVASVDDYSNPTYIPGDCSEMEFVVAQDPTSNAFEDFWRMIWGNNINTVVMLSESSQIGKAESENYWPTHETQTHGNITVTFVSETVLPEWTVRDLKLTNLTSKESYALRQFHYTPWYKSDDYLTRDVFIQFVQLVRNQRKPNKRAEPVLVHSSLGDSRDLYPTKGTYSLGDTRDLYSTKGTYSLGDSRDLYPTGFTYSLGDSRDLYPTKGIYSLGDSRDLYPTKGTYSLGDRRDLYPTKGTYSLGDSRDLYPTEGTYSLGDSRDLYSTKGTYSLGDSRDLYPTEGTYSLGDSRDLGEELMPIPHPGIEILFSQEKKLKGHFWLLSQQLDINVLDQYFPTWGTCDVSKRVLNNYTGREESKNEQGDRMPAITWHCKTFIFPADDWSLQFKNVCHR
ncbi:receptor-type tyrosine-protein phosphatase beta-like [Pelodytes ibericus]